MKSLLTYRWCLLAGALALAAVLAPSLGQAKTAKQTRTTKAAATPQAVPATNPAAPATIINEHIFTTLAGKTPSNDLVIDGAGSAYGVTQTGGTNDAGTIFRVGADGTISTLYNFGTAANGSGYSADGNAPIAGLLLAPDGNFYGTTTSGGAVDDGTLFSFNPNTGVLTTLASFDPSTTGYYSTAPLVTDGSGNFYGTAQYEGNPGYGTVFVYSTASGTLTDLAGFDYGATGRNPTGRLVFGADGNLYGTTSYGSYNGTVFQFNPTTNALTEVFNFSDYNTYGYTPLGGLVTDGSGHFYGTTQNGGSNGSGTVFELTEDTTVNPPTFTPSVLYAFTSSNNGTMGYAPAGALLLGADGNLYGTTEYGGTDDDGTVFQLVLNTPDANGNATTVNTLHSFDYADGYNPTGTLATDAAGDLYGTFPYGETGSGGVFELTATATAGQYGFNSLSTFPAAGSDPIAGLTLGDDGNFYGTTESGGPNNDGTVFVFNPTTGVTTTIYNFDYETFVNGNPVYDGAFPQGKLVSAGNGVFYGTANGGGPDGDGTLFQLTTTTDPTTGAITGTVIALYLFTGNPDDGDTVRALSADTGSEPVAGLTLAADGNYYGTTTNGGASGDGEIFQFNPTAGTVSNVASFDPDTTGYYATAPLTVGADGNLYGVARNGPGDGDGSVFEYNLTTGALSVVAGFTGQNGDTPSGGLTLGVDGTLYGTTQYGGPQDDDGTLFQVVPGTGTAAGTINTLVVFNGSNGAYPNTPLVQDAAGNFYGTTEGQGANGDGTVYEYNPATGAFTTLANFGQGAGFNATGGLTLSADGQHLYGVTSGGEDEGDDDFVATAPASSQAGTTHAKAHAAVRTHASKVASVATRTGKTRSQAKAQARVQTDAVTTTNTPVLGPLAVTDNDGTIFELAIVPTVTSSPTAVGTVGTAFGFQVTGTSDPTAFAATGLPDGLMINATTGIISGTPTTAGTSTVAVTVGNAGGSVSQTLTIVIQAATMPPLMAPAPVITSGAPPSGQVGVAFSYQITASNTPTSFGATGLPAGLAIDPATGIISGTPTAAGTFGLTVSATNAGGTNTAGFVLTIASGAPAVIAPAVTSAASANAVVGQAFSYQVAASNTPTSFGANGLPAGLTINATTGLISGAATTAGTFPVTLSATNAGGTGTATLTLSVTAAPATTPVIGSPVTTSGQVGQPFDYQITASNSPTAYAATGLPDGLTINATTGLISGTPTTAGNYTVTLSATNAGGTAPATLTLTVTAAVLELPVISSATAASDQVAVAFSYQIDASNSPVAYGATGLPAGLSINDQTGVISGTPTTAGTYPVTLMATNSAGSGTATLTLTIAAQPLPVISIIASVPSVTLGTGELAEFAVTRTGGDDTQTIVVNYTVSGSAQPGVDYVMLKGTRMFNPNKTTVRIKVTPEGTLDGVAKKNLKVTLQPGDGYTLGTSTAARVHILAAP